MHDEIALKEKRERRGEEEGQRRGGREGKPWVL